MDKLIHTHSFCFNPGENGGESLRLVTKFYHNGDKLNGKPDPKAVYTNQDLILQSYNNQASISLFGASISADILEKAAKALRDAEHEVELSIVSEK